PDRELNRVAGLPEFLDRILERLAPPRDRRHETASLAADVQAGRAAEAEAGGPCLEGLAALGRQVVEELPHAVEVRVARLLERGRQRQRSVDVRIPVMEDLRD